MRQSHPMAQELMAKNPIPIPLQYVTVYLGLAIIGELDSSEDSTKNNAS
jgi:hypothetical protein